MSLRYAPPHKTPDICNVCMNVVLTSYLGDKGLIWAMFVPLRRRIVKLCYFGGSIALKMLLKNATHLLAYNPQGKRTLNSFCMNNSTLCVEYIVLTLRLLTNIISF